MISTMVGLVWAPPNMHSTVHKNPPEVLLCALQPPQIADWRDKNKWADSIDMIIFTDAEPPAAVKAIMPVRPFADRTGLVPHIVVNAPPEALADLDIIRATQYHFGPSAATPGVELKAGADAAMRYRDAVRAVGRSLRGIRCAWVQPESDHALGACGVAKEVGMCIAYSAKPMIDSIGAMAANKMGVNVRTLGTISAREGLS